ncbi:MAG: ABC transporter ATP-binding protein [Candidatus Moranbacteria bacterium]|nr:ABC transporter ATP-binding protein [Candidatus Moranbacteria bacterium]
MNKDIAISVKNVSKTFKIPHEKISSLRGAAVSAFKKNSYEEFKALDDVSFEVKKGEFFGIIGRNGSGKSTLLKILAGIYQTDKGSVKIDGRISPFLELGIGFNPELSGRDNVYLNATVLGLSKKEIDKKFDSIVQFSELERFIDQKLKNYSSGMQVRLAFSVSIHANREILLMDEVLAVGDSNFQSKCLSEFSKYRDAGKTVILVTHDIATVQRYCDRALLLRNGKIIKIGKAEDVGTEYMYQNMSDEEKRIFDEEKQKKDGKEKNVAISNEENKTESHKIAEITKVEFLDKDGKEKNVFETGDDMSIRVYFDIKKAKNDLNFGLAVHSQDGLYIFGINTFIDDVDKEKYIKLGYFQINFFNLPLKNNTYYIKAAVHGDNAFKNYDLLEKSSEFKFVSKKKSHGFIEVDYEWN